MPCFHPITAFKQKPSLETGKARLIFKSTSTENAIQIPCGQCLGCRMEKARQWTARIMHEASQHKNCKFITLTYEKQPLNNSLNKRDIQLFLKKLRKYLSARDERVRFYQCGEYGDEKGRPHHHMAVFTNAIASKKGLARTEGERAFHLFEDEEEISSGKNKIYKSVTLGKLWGKGFVSIGDLTYDSASYIAQYVTKKITGKKAEKHYNGRLPEYSTMSRRPGIGKTWWDKYKDDVEKIDGIIFKGNKLKPPRYYDNEAEKINPQELKTRKEKRLLEAKQFTSVQLKAKEIVAKQKYSQHKRSLENGARNLCH